MSDRRFMEAALALGVRGAGRVWPNPAVGCVIVRDNRIIGRGWTAPGGRPHAEPQALAQAGPAARGATAYVTLEPCAHYGHTPPCAEALIKAGVARVVSAIDDPDPRVAGGGHAMLEAAGITVETGLCREAAERAHRGFFARLTTGRPAVTLKLATSLDGRIATATGESQWITGPGARRLGHGLRARHDAVLVGGGTARADNPSLTVRGLGVPWQPVRVVAARRLDLPEGSNLEQSAGDTAVWLLHGSDAPQERQARWRDAGARLFEVEVAPNGHLDPTAMLDALGAAGLTTVYCEGGGMLAAALLQAGLVQSLAVFTAGVAIGAEGQPGLGPMGLDRLAQAPRFTLRETRSVFGDTLSLWDAPTPQL